MRRALREEFPAWCEKWPGLRPWDIAGGPEELTWGEIDAFRRYAEKQHREHEFEMRKARAGR